MTFNFLKKTRKSLWRKIRITQAQSKENNNNVIIETIELNFNVIKI